VLLTAAVLALVYVYAPRIVAAVPGAAAPLTPYVAAVDDGRLWLDLRLQGLLRLIEGAPSGTTAPPAPDASLDASPEALAEDPAIPAVEE